MPIFVLSRVTCPTILALVFLRLRRLRDVLFTYEHFDSRDLVQYTDAVGVTALTCRTPGGEVLFRNLSFRVQQGESLLIMGPSGSGAWRRCAPDDGCGLGFCSHCDALPAVAHAFFLPL